MNSCERQAGANMALEVRSRALETAKKVFTLNKMNVFFTMRVCEGRVKLTGHPSECSSAQSPDSGYSAIGPLGRAVP